MQNGAVSLDKLCRLVLHQSLDKSQRFTDRAVPHHQLTEDQKKYAALDVIVSRHIFIELEKMMSDLTRRLNADEVVVGKQVDIVPRNGSVANWPLELPRGQLWTWMSAKAQMGFCQIELAVAKVMQSSNWRPYTLQR